MPINAVQVLGLLLVLAGARGEAGPATGASVQKKPAAAATKDASHGHKSGENMPSCACVHRNGKQVCHCISEQTKKVLNIKEIPTTSHKAPQKTKVVAKTTTTIKATSKAPTTTHATNTHAATTTTTTQRPSTTTKATTTHSPATTHRHTDPTLYRHKKATTTTLEATTMKATTTTTTTTTEATTTTTHRHTTTTATPSHQRALRSPDQSNKQALHDQKAAKTEHTVAKTAAPAAHKGQHHTYFSPDQHAAEAPHKRALQHPSQSTKQALHDHSVATHPEKWNPAADGGWITAEQHEKLQAERLKAALGSSAPAAEHKNGHRAKHTHMGSHEEPTPNPFKDPAEKTKKFVHNLRTESKGLLKEVDSTRRDIIAGEKLVGGTRLE